MPARALYALILVLACAIACSSRAPGESRPATKEPEVGNVHVVIIIGHSNGRGIAAADGRSDSTIPFLDWLPGQTQPITLSTLGPSVYANQGIEIQLALDLKAAGKTVAVIKSCADGSKIYDDWAPLAWRWVAARLAVRIGMDLIRPLYPPGTRFIRHGIIVHGENDANNSTYALAYEAKLRVLASDAMNELELDDLGFVKTHSFMSFAPNYKPNVQAATVQVASESSRYYLIDADIGVPGNVSHISGIHFTQLGYNVLGAYTAQLIGKSDRPAGSGKSFYRVKVGKTLRYGGVFYPAGSELCLGEADAQSVDDFLDLIGEQHP